MTEMGTFIINGGERIIVSQLVRSPGVYFNDKVDKTVLLADQLFQPWGRLELETDLKDAAVSTARKFHLQPLCVFDSLR